MCLAQPCFRKGLLAILFSIALLSFCEPALAMEPVCDSFFSQPPSPQGSGLAQTSNFPRIIYLPLVIRRYPLLPPTPVLDASGENHTVILTWSSVITDVPVSYYEVQESLVVDFSSLNAYTTTELGLVFSDKPFATYHYRVRGVNGWGNGAWSNVVTVVLLDAFFDDFDDSSTGWYPRRTSSPDLSLMSAVYVNGNLETMVADKFDFAIFSPMRQAPKLPYTIEMRTMVEHRVNEVSYGIVFGGNPGAFCDVTRDTSMSMDGCFSHYYRLNVVWGGPYLKYNVCRITGHDDRGRGKCDELMGFYNLASLGYNSNDWHIWKVQVSETGFSIYVNGNYLVHIADTMYVNDPYYGIFSSAYEYNYAHFIHSRFYVYPTYLDNARNLADLNTYPQ
ncbi:MAG TPA: fibronectin type III domain-containing protein [Anaerolineae bacterium]|nr:fibronectin type III domain-containing protein [Anaerolineae bacterium]